MTEVVILGGSGVGMIAAYIAETLGIKVLGFLNDNLPVGSTIGLFKKYQVLGTSGDVHKIVEPENRFVVLAYKTMKHEWSMFNNLISLGIPREKFTNLIHPEARIPTGFCLLGKGIIAAPNAQVSTDVIIADNCFLLGNCFIGHDSLIQQYVSVTNNVSIGAEVRIGRGSHIGSNSTIREKVRIGDFSLVGMGSVVLNDVPSRAIVVGTPAKQIGTTE